MCCEAKHEKKHHHGCGCKNGGHIDSHGQRRNFMTKQEQLEKLEQYKETLQKELQGVDEHIAELKQ